MENDHRQLAKGVLVNVLGMLAKASRPLFLIIFSRILGAEKFGLYMLAFATQEIVSKLAALGLDMGITRLVGRLLAQGRKDDVRAVVQKTLMVGVGTSGVVALALGLLADPVSRLILGTERLGSPLRNFCWGMPAVCATTMILYSIRPTLRMQFELYVRSVVEPLLILVLGILALHLDLGVQGLSFAHNIAALAAMVLAWVFFLKIYPAKKGPLANVNWKLLWNTGVPMGANELLNTFKNRLDVMVIGRFMSLTNVGIYSAVLEIGSVLRKLRATVDPVLMPMAQAHHERADTVRLNRNLSLALRWVMIPSMALFGVMLVVPQVFLRFFGEAFEPGSAALRIMAGGQLVCVTLGLLEGVLLMVGYAYVPLINSAVMIGLNLLLLRFMVPRWGLEGAAWATCISFTVIALWRLDQARRLVGARPFEKGQLKPILAFFISCGITGLVMVWTHPTSLVSQIGMALFFILIYTAAMLSLPIEERDRDILRQVRERLPKSIGAARKWISTRIKGN
ncbi:MAG: oligosaccharide flippase family protein [Pseudomonadota bacterium]